MVMGGTRLSGYGSCSSCNKDNNGVWSDAGFAWVGLAVDGRPGGSRTGTGLVTKSPCTGDGAALVTLSVELVIGTAAPGVAFNAVVVVVVVVVDVIINGGFSGVSAAGSSFVTTTGCSGVDASLAGLDSRGMTGDESASLGITLMMNGSICTKYPVTLTSSGLKRLGGIISCQCLPRQTRTVKASKSARPGLFIIF